MEMESIIFPMGLSTKASLKKDCNMEWAVFPISRGKLSCLDIGRMENFLEIKNLSVMK